MLPGDAKPPEGDTELRRQRAPRGPSPRLLTKLTFGFAVFLMAPAVAFAACRGYSGPGGACYSGPGGGLYAGPEGGAYAGPGGGLYAGPGGGLYAGPGGACMPVQAAVCMPDPEGGYMRDPAGGSTRGHHRTTVTRGRGAHALRA